MKVLKWILIVAIVLLVSIFAIGFAMPREVIVTTSQEINLPPSKVFHFVAGFVDRTAWDPWIKGDTAVRCTFDLKTGYAGSKYNWEGPKLGKGNMEVDSVAIGTYILNKVYFSKGEPVPEIWTFEPAGNGTNLTWTIKLSSSSPVGRLTNTLFKGMILKTIENGKSDLKDYLETHGVRMSTLTEIKTDDFPALEALTSSTVTTMQQMALVYGELLGKVMAEMQTQGIQPQGSPFALYSGFDQATGQMTITAGIPVSSGAKPEGDVKVSKFKGFTALSGLHTGPYDELMISYQELEKYAAENNIGLGTDAWEFYVNDPTDIIDPRNLQTLIAMPIKSGK